MPERDLTLAYAGLDGASVQVAEADDVALVRGLREGSSAAAAFLVDRYSTYVQRMLVRVLGNDPELPDLVQDVFVQALSGIHDLRSPAALGGWLARIAVYVARGRIRQRTRRRWLLFFSSDVVPDVAAESAGEGVMEALRAVYRAFDRMPADERIPLALRLIEGMSVEEIADACAVSVATVKRRLARGHARFAALCERDPVLREWMAKGGPCPA